MTELVLKQEVYEIVGAAIEVYWRLGRGFLEPIYQEAIEIELGRRAIPFEARKKLTIKYKGQALRKKYIPDLFCYGEIIAELKVCERLESRQAAQLVNYLKATGCRVGLLINFGSPGRLEWRRYVFRRMEKSRTLSCGVKEFFRSVRSTKVSFIVGPGIGN